MNQRNERKAPRELAEPALQLYRKGELEDAAPALSALANDYPADLEVRFAAGSTLLRLNRFAEAIPHFASYVEAYPKHEWASLGLFHSLWRADRKREALQELRRFDDAGGESMEYRRMQKEVLRVWNAPEET